MHEAVISEFILCFSCVALTFSQDSFYEITDFSKERYRSPQQRYVDIYTNYPNMETVLRTYEHLKNSGEKYVYPKSNLQFYNKHVGTNSYNFQTKRTETNRRGYYSPPGDNEDFVKFDDVLQSDYGDFELYKDHLETQNSDSEGDEFLRKGRPKFKTGKNSTGDLYDQDYFTNIQKIPRLEHLDDKNETDEDINMNLRNLLKKYLIQLYRKKHQNTFLDDNKKEVFDFSTEVSDNIETLDNSEENNKKFYDVLHDVPPNNLHVNKSKLLDPSNLIILKNSTKLLANKFLSLFTIIQFPNTPCVGMSNLNYYDGTCYYSTECEAMNGTAMGSCANGYGVCCVCK